MAGQLAPGDIIVASGIGSFRMTVFDPATGVGEGLFPSPFVPGFHSVLWDPGQPERVLTGGDAGFLAAASWSTGATPVLSTLAPYAGAGGLTRSFSFGPAGTLVGVVSGTGGLRSFDLATGTTSLLVTGPQPWGNNPTAAAWDPVIAELHIGSSQGLFRWSPTAGATTVSNAWATTYDPPGVGGLALDPFSSDVFITLGGLNLLTRVLRVSPMGGLSDLVTPGSLLGPGPLCIDESGDLVIQDGLNGFLYRVPQLGGAPALLAVAGYASDVTVVGGLDYGTPSNPYALWASRDSGGVLELRLRWFAASATGGMLLASEATGGGFGAGPQLGIVPDALTLAIIASSPVPVAGNPFHFPLGGPPLGFPYQAWRAPPGVTALLSGSTLDFVSFTYDASFSLAEASNVARLTF